MTKNVGAGRKLESWIESFVSNTSNLDSPEIFRRWSAISAIATTLEQKVYLVTSAPIFPHLYVFLVGHPGTGKSRSIKTAVRYVNELTEPHIAPKSLTFASLVDCMVRHKRSFIQHPNPMVEYNSTLIAADELGSFIHKFDKEMADGLSEFYDPTPYGHERRGGEIRIKMKSPQINMLCGSTPSNLYDTLPDSAWGQGFTSRIIMVFSDERIIGDDFANITRELSVDMIHDLKHIDGIRGEYKVTPEYVRLINLWRQQGEKPFPAHPKLIHYGSRRRVNLYKLSMISAIDRSDELLLTREDFNRAIGWLHEAEMYMEDIFKSSGGGTDSKAIEEIYHFVLTQCVGGKVCPERRIISFAKERVPIHSVARVVEVMIASGQLVPTPDFRTGQRNFKAGVPDMGGYEF